MIRYLKYCSPTGHLISDVVETFAHLLQEEEAIFLCGETYPYVLAVDGKFTEEWTDCARKAVEI